MPFLFDSFPFFSINFVSIVVIGFPVLPILDSLGMVAITIASVSVVP